MGIVPALDEVEDRHAGLGLGVKRLLIEQLALERGKEALTHRVVVAVGHGAHGRSNPGLLAAQPEGDRRVLAALVRVMNDVVGSSLSQGHVQRVEHEFCAQVRRHRPAHDLPAPGIEDNRQVQDPRPGRNLGDIGDPQLIRARSPEGALDQVGGRTGIRLATRRTLFPSTTRALETRPSHQSCDPPPGMGV